MELCGKSCGRDFHFCKPDDWRDPTSECVATVIIAETAWSFQVSFSNPILI